MRRHQIHLDDKQGEQLKRLAREYGTSVADLIRRAVDRYLREEGPARRIKRWWG